MPLAGINSILPGLNRFKPVKTTGRHKSISATGWYKSNLSRFFSNPGLSHFAAVCNELFRLVSDSDNEDSDNEDSTDEPESEGKGMLYGQ